MSLVRFSVAPHETLVDAFYGGLLYLCHVVTSVSLDLFRVRWSVSGKLGSGGNPICVVREPDYEENRLVRTKTFSTHDEPKICHVVRESGVFTHGKNFHEGEVVALKRHFVLWSARWGWSLWRFASLIPSGCRLPPIHKARALKKRAV